MSVTGNKKAALKVRRNDLYETPPVAVQALMRAEKLPRVIWEPACGSGNIVKTLRAAGHEVIATDLVDYGCPDSASGRDFLMEHKLPDGVEIIITNPPFKLAEQFVEHALALCPRVVFLCRLAFYESERRANILESGSLANIYVFKNRLPTMHREGWDGPKASSGMCFAWFSWNLRYSGPTLIHRISYKEESRNV